jgi:ParB family chromosome partitioning protein
MNIDETMQKLKSKNLNYWEQAETFRNILLDTDITQTELARMIGLKQTTISNKIRLLKLPQGIQSIIKDKGLEERYARALLRINDEKLQRKAIEHIFEFDLNIRETEDYIEKLLKVTNNSLNIKAFISILLQGIKVLKAKGIIVGSKKIERENCTDLIIRFHR